MQKRFLALGCLAAFLLAVGGSAISGQEGASYTLVIKSVQVQTTNADNKSWDINDGKPDLMVIVRNQEDKDQKAFQTEEKTDTFSADFNAPTTIKARAGQNLEIEVVDRDVAVNDTSGKTTLKVESDGTKRFEKFGRVILLVVELKKL